MTIVLAILVVVLLGWALRLKSERDRLLAERNRHAYYAAQQQRDWLNGVTQRRTEEWRRRIDEAREARKRTQA